MWISRKKWLELNEKVSKLKVEADICYDAIGTLGIKVRNLDEAAFVEFVSKEEGNGDDLVRRKESVSTIIVKLMEMYGIEYRHIEEHFTLKKK